MNDLKIEKGKFQDLDSGDPNSTPSQRAMKFAADNGLLVTKGSDTLLLIDLDNEAGKRQFFETWDHMITGREIEYNSALWTPSRSGGAHVVIVLKHPMEIMERLLIQACLGSDLTRERISWRRVINHDETPTLLLDLPDAAWKHLPSLKDFQITKGAARVDATPAARPVPVRNVRPADDKVNRRIPKKVRPER